MDKYNYSKQVETYLEERKVYDMFQNLTKQLLIHRPESPIDFLIENIPKKEPIRVFIVGPPGSMAKSLARRLSKDLDFTTISVGEIIRKEISKNNETGSQLSNAKDYRLIPDKTIMKIMKSCILKSEKEGKNWILEGFPRTKAQALTLQRIGVIPDKFILLNVEREHSVERIKKALIDQGSSLIGDELDEAAEKAINEYDLHIKGVRESYEKFIYEAEVDKTLEEMEQDLLKMVKIKTKDPMRPPRIIILGPPGSGRSTQAESLSKRYGIVHISTVSLLKEEMAKKTSRGEEIARCIAKGEMVPSTTVISLVKHRLKQSDCMVNGWVMDGFPK